MCESRQALQAGGWKAQHGLLPQPDGVNKSGVSRMVLENPGKAGETPVGENDWPPVGDLEYRGAR